MCQEEVFLSDHAIRQAMECVRRAYNELTPDSPIENIGGLAQAPLIDHENGAPIFGFVVLRKGLCAASHHLIPADEKRVREKIGRGHRPVLVGAVWSGNILSVETGYKIMDLAEAHHIDRRTRELLRVFSLTY